MDLCEENITYIASLSCFLSISFQFTSFVLINPHYRISSRYKYSLDIIVICLRVIMNRYGQRELFYTFELATWKTCLNYCLQEEVLHFDPGRFGTIHFEVQTKTLLDVEV